MKAIRIHPKLLRQIRAQSKAERQHIERRIADAQRCIGQPHLHKGLGLRKLQDNYFEIRIGLKLRLVFENAARTLIFEFMGDHDEVRQFLKGK